MTANQKKFLELAPRYKAAYEVANGIAPELTLTYEGGFANICIGQFDTRVRLSELKKMAETLEKRAAVENSNH